MAIPEFVAGPDGYGVLPSGRWTCSSDEFHERFVEDLPDSLRRKQIYDDWEEYQRRQLAAGFIVVNYWIDGSFTTAKLNPGDIDVTAIIDGTKSRPGPAASDWLNPGGRWKSVPHPDVARILLVDGYGMVKYPDGHADIAQYHLLRGYWDDWWLRCRASGEEPTKGYLEVRPRWT